MLGSPRFSQLLAWAETVYDLILIDSPPTLATTDTAIIGRLVDGVILVVQPAKNRRRLVTRVVERLGLMKIPVLGLVVNRTGSEEDHGYYGYHSYGYGYGVRLWIRVRPRRGRQRPSSRDGRRKRANEECVPFADRIGHDADDEEEPPATRRTPTRGVKDNEGKRNDYRTDPTVYWRRHLHLLTTAVLLPVFAGIYYWASGCASKAN